jgi:hypothetical protein
MSRPDRGGKRIRVSPLLLAFAFVAVVAAQGAQSEATSSLPAATASQGTPAQADDKTDKNSPEMASRDVTPTFQVNVKLILVRVVVRDSQGHALGTFRQEDFQVFDKGKPEVISQFSVEQPGTRAATEMKAATRLRLQNTLPPTFLTTST